MTSFVRIPSPALDVADVMTRYGVGPAEALRMVEAAAATRVYRNGAFQVSLSGPFPWLPSTPGVFKMSIVPLFPVERHLWSEFQKIKNEFFSPEHEAFEIYPAESRLVDHGLEYHLWVVSAPSYRIPIGWTHRMVREDSHV